MGVRLPSQPSLKPECTLSFLWFYAPACDITPVMHVMSQGKYPHPRYPSGDCDITPHTGEDRLGTHRSLSHRRPPSSGRTAYGRPAQCTCPPPFAASRPHLRNRGEAIGRSRSTAAAVASEEIVGARSVTKCDGRKSYDPQFQKSASKYFIFFGHFSRRCQLRKRADYSTER
eukprot:scaffold130919_cov63-Phaeocystis_antarctica.AAC.2